MGVERVYIGGLDPARLTIDDVFERLRRDTKKKVELRELKAHRSLCYGHLDAVSLQDDHTALEILRKLYNNVKWKGCKIRVEAAQPCFLDRLEQEREERRTKELETKTKGEAAFQDTTELATKIPRHLKIRRGYGEESWKVDTKPWRVEDWSTFRKMRTRLVEKKKQQQEKFQKLTKQERRKYPSVDHLTKAHLNRSVHLKFAEVKPVDASIPCQRSASDHPKRRGESSSTTDSSSSSSSSNEANTPGKNGTYIWSDDEGSSSDASLDVDNHAPDDSHRAYAWSDSEASEHENSTRSHEGDDRAEESSLNADLDPDGGTAGDMDLQQDVQSNLNVLGDLFPELAGKKAIEEMDHERETANKTVNEGSGWGSAGQMLRFDPTKANAVQFSKDKRAENTSASSESDTEVLNNSMVEVGDNDNDATSSPEIDTKEQTKEERAEDIYEQGKLEEVFRDARKAESLPAIVKTTEDAPNGGFSFGFQLTEKPAEGEKGAFSFSFQVPQKGATLHEAPDNKRILDNVETTADDAMHVDHDQKLQGRIGLSFSSEDIDHYVGVFYSLNEGKRIQEDLDGFRNDARVQESWESQRRILTQDWKRKRKYAQAQRKKRFTVHP